MTISHSIIIPACNEAGYISDCLEALAMQQGSAELLARVEVIVVANGCQDATAEVARDLSPRLPMSLHVITIAAAGKHLALNAGDKAAQGANRIYLDADVCCGPTLLVELLGALDRPEARLASGTLLPVASSRVSRDYARVWSRLPFIARGVPACGLYAVNEAGRQRWSVFPPIHSDDKFVRLQFSPAERVRVGAVYRWPVPEGWRNLLRVRRRWCEGNAEFARRYPRLIGNEGPRGTFGDAARLLLTMPRATAMFVLIYAAAWLLANAAPGHLGEWRRGR